MTCSLELAFNHDSRLYVYELQPDWYEEFLSIEDEIAAPAWRKTTRTKAIRLAGISPRINGRHDALGLPAPIDARQCSRSGRRARHRRARRQGAVRPRLRRSAKRAPLSCSPPSKTCTTPDAARHGRGRGAHARAPSATANASSSTAITTWTAPPAWSCSPRPSNWPAASPSTTCPHRLKDGYGMRPEVVEAAAAEGVTPDRQRGYRHPRRRSGAPRQRTRHRRHRHRPSPARERNCRPPLAVLNPNRPDCTYPEKNLCGAGVAFKLIQALLARTSAFGLDRPTGTRVQARGRDPRLEGRAHPDERVRPRPRGARHVRHRVHQRPARAPARPAARGRARVIGAPRRSARRRRVHAAPRRHGRPALAPFTAPSETWWLPERRHVARHDAHRRLRVDSTRSRASHWKRARTTRSDKVVLRGGVTDRPDWISEALALKAATLRPRPPPVPA